MVKVAHWYFVKNFHCAFDKINQCKGPAKQCNSAWKKALPCSGIELIEQLLHGGLNVWNVKLHEMEALE